MERQNTEILKFTEPDGRRIVCGGADGQETEAAHKGGGADLQASGKLLKATTLIAAAAGAARLAKSFLDFSDTQAQITARLNLMNDGFRKHPH
mgnify:FL=1